MADHPLIEKILHLISIGVKPKLDLQSMFSYIITLKIMNLGTIQSIIPGRCWGFEFTDDHGQTNNLIVADHTLRCNRPNSTKPVGALSFTFHYRLSVSNYKQRLTGPVRNLFEERFLSKRAAVPLPSPQTKPNLDWLTMDRSLHLDKFTLQPVEHGSQFAAAFDNLPPVVGKPPNRGWDNEGYDALHLYFWHQTNGIVLESGALDGHAFSVSADFRSVGWHRILVEANPSYWPQAKILSPDATYVAAAICNPTGRLVHYISPVVSTAEQQAIGGIAEFMSPSFLQQFYPELAISSKVGQFGLSSLDWNSPEMKTVKRFKTTPLRCVSITNILKEIGIATVNMWVLDVEGAELSVLQTVDWDKTTFNVICIETDKQFRPAGYESSIIAFLKPLGYRYDRTQGRNSWFLHEKFSPSSKPSKSI
jgi:hypothetical protein